MPAGTLSQLAEGAMQLQPTSLAETVAYEEKAEVNELQLAQQSDTAQQSGTVTSSVAAIV